MVHAGSWAFALHVADRSFGLGRTIVLARLLSPEDFGLFGIAILAMIALETFSRTGFHPALIQKIGDIKPYLDIVWTVHAIRGLILALILFGVAPYVAAFFGEPAAVPIVQVIGLSLIFQGLTNVGTVYFQKELVFHKQFVYMFSGTVVDMVVAITAAVLLWNAWALLFGLLAGNVVRMVVSYLVHPYRPRLRIDRQKFTDLFRFGVWVSFTGIMLFIGSHGAGVVVGKVIGITSLGLYQLAYGITQATINELTAVIGSVAFPTYTQLQSNAARLREAYLRIAGFSVTLSTPIAIGIATLGGDFTRIFLGEQWTPMIPALSILALAALIQSTASTGRPAFMGRGHPQVVFHMQCAGAASILIFIYPLSIRLGISGAALSVLLSSLCMFIVWYSNIKRQLELSLGDIGRMLGPPLVSSMAMAGALFVFKFSTIALLSPTRVAEIIWFAAASLVAVAVYVLTMHACKWIFPEYQLFRGVAKAIRS